MSFPRYPSYKDSGVEWLGEIPAHWALPKLKHIARFSGGGTPSRDNLEFWGGDIPWVSPKDMKVELVGDAEERITQLGLANSTTNLVPPGRLLMVVRSGILKHTIPVAINTVEVALNQDMKAFDFRDGPCTTNFFLRWVQGLNDVLLLEWAKQGATVESIEHAYLAETLVPLPPLSEQAGIACFLDNETAKIDCMVAEQRALIELLKEKRQAVISHAVTKGLNPDAPMKDSGVEWLGAVPTHWEVTRMKRISPEVTVGIVVEPSKYYVEDDGVSALRSLNIRPGRIVLDDVVLISREANERLAKTRLRAGDLVVVRSGQPGTTAIVPDEMGGLNCIDLIIIRKPTTVSSEFLCWFMGSDAAQRQFSEGSEGAIQQHFNIRTALNIVVPQPPEREQQDIVDFLKNETAMIDALTAEAEQAITLLQERRTALVSAAVTGKIDIRGFARQAAE